MLLSLPPWRRIHAHAAVGGPDCHAGAGIGFCHGVLGLIVTIPVLRHATWHAYRFDPADRRLTFRCRQTEESARFESWVFRAVRGPQRSAQRFLTLNAGGDMAIVGRIRRQQSRPCSVWSLDSTARTAAG